ncbi:hypothetical protein ACE6H2_026046 [Prunus campanulata]
MLWGSNEVKIFMKLVPMGVYYNISKFQPNWTFVECLARPTLNLAQEDLQLPAFCHVPLFSHVPHPSYI